jgi:hypothetical protein
MALESDLKLSTAKFRENAVSAATLKLNAIVEEKSASGPNWWEVSQSPFPIPFAALRTLKRNTRIMIPISLKKPQMTISRAG